METRQITTLDELKDIAREVVSSCVQKENAHVVTLTGDLGAGKTAFTKELAKLLGITHEITSPTFVIMKAYEIPDHPFFKKLVHIDAYRIESDDEMRVLGFNEILSDPTNLVCIEWPEKIKDLIPKDAYSLSLTLNLDETRTITYGKSN
ncbi:MAG: tRNA (adenosine(37)-N6)-threonylcarbamoyltransferase complex ATPase subunit type 1 TsaE [Minisyncoccia bacterium]